MDISRDACAIAEQNANTCGYATPDRRAAVCASAEAALRGEPPAMAGKRFDLVSLTPPYEEISYADLLEPFTRRLFSCTLFLFFTPKGLARPAFSRREISLCSLRASLATNNGALKFEPLFPL